MSFIHTAKAHVDKQLQPHSLISAIVICSLKSIIPLLARCRESLLYANFKYSNLSL